MFALRSQIQRSAARGFATAQTAPKNKLVPVSVKTFLERIENDRLDLSTAGHRRRRR